MQILRTIFWVIILVLLVAFSVANWKLVTVQIWDGLLLETRLPALVILSFLLGLIPMWLLYRSHVWRLKRRITALENAQKANSLNYARDNTETIRDRDGDGIPDSVDPAPDAPADTDARLRPTRPGDAPASTAAMPPPVPPKSDVT